LAGEILFIAQCDIPEAAENGSFLFAKYLQSLNEIKNSEVVES
jgi:hypothetical protein